MSIVNCLFDLSGTVYMLFHLLFVLLGVCPPLSLCSQLLLPFPVILLTVCLVSPSPLAERA